MLLDKYSIRLCADQKIWSRSNILSPASWIAASMKLDLSGNWWAIPASQLSWWVMERYDNWSHLAVAHIILQALPCNWQLVTDRFCKTQATENAIYLISGYLAVLYPSLWSSRSKMSDQSHLWYPVKPPLFFLHPNNTLFPLTSWSVCPKFITSIRTITQWQWGAFSVTFFPLLLWVSNFNRFFSSHTIHKLKLDEG